MKQLTSKQKRELRRLIEKLPVESERQEMIERWEREEMHKSVSIEQDKSVKDKRKVYENVLRNRS